MLAVLLLCIAHNVASTPYRDGDVEGRIRKENVPADVYRHAFKYDDDYHLEGSRKQERRLVDRIEEMLRKQNKTKPEFADDKLKFRQAESNLTDVLAHLSTVLNQILNVVKYTKQDEFHEINDYLQNDSVRNVQRSKRDAEEATENVTEIAAVRNETASATNSSGRRTLTRDVPVTTDEVRTKLFAYIQEGFTEIVSKVDSLRPVKTMFDNDAAYKIGYIVANVDTLDVNMQSLKKGMDSNKYNWDDYQILNLYDTVKMSNTVVTNLLDMLKNFLENGFNGNLQ